MKFGKRWGFPAIAAIASGPLIASAEATGQLELPVKSMVVYVLSGGLTVIGSMFAAILYFLKREHTAITTGIASNNAALGAATKTINDRVGELSDSVAALSLALEQNAGEFRAELAKCVKVSDNAASFNRLHEKVNGLDRSLAYLRAKLGLPETPIVSAARVAEADAGDGDA